MIPWSTASMVSFVHFGWLANVVDQSLFHVIFHQVGATSKGHVWTPIQRRRVFWLQTAAHQRTFTGKLYSARQNRRCQVMVSRHGTLFTFVPGRMDRERGKPVADDTIFRIYSMTKPITSIAR